jgi:type II secretory pathway pseudopilin PulG
MQPLGRRQAGFTILELAIGMLVLAIFLGGAFSMVVRNNQIARQNQAKLAATQAIRQGNERIQPLLREADRVIYDTVSIPAAVLNLCGNGFFPARTTGPSALVLRIPVFNGDGSLSTEYSYALLNTTTSSSALMATYVIMRPDGTVNYKRRNEVLIANWSTPKDKSGNLLDPFTYFSDSGTQISSVTASNVNTIARIRIALASQDSNLREKQWSQLTSEIRLANQSTRNFLPFIIYNPNGSTRIINGIDISGPTTATLTRIELGTVALWSGTHTLTSTSQRLSLTSGSTQTITGMITIPATLWFTPTSNFSGSYQVRLATSANDSLASTFTN